jgi:hypothetical protein
MFSRAAENAINELLEVAKQSIDEKTPEDTKELVLNNEIIPAKEEQQGTVSGSVKNETEYGVYVEYGVEGKKYGYHKPKGQLFHIGVGAGMFTRTIAETEDKAEKIIEKHFDSLIDDLNR